MPYRREVNLGPHRMTVQQDFIRGEPVHGAIGYGLPRSYPRPRVNRAATRAQISGGPHEIRDVQPHEILLRPTGAAHPHVYDYGRVVRLGRGVDLWEPTRSR